MIDYIIGIVALNKQFLVEKIRDIGGDMHGDDFDFVPGDQYVIDPDESSNLLPVIKINFELYEVVCSACDGEGGELKYALRDLKLEELINIYKLTVE